MRKTTPQRGLSPQAAALSAAGAWVALDRGFVPAREEPPDELDVLAEVLATRDALSWRDLLARRRVVILAEAGSGKSTELEEQARLQRAAGQFAFVATVQNVGRLGLETALRADAQRLAELCKTFDVVRRINALGPISFPANRQVVARSLT